MLWLNKSKRLHLALESQAGHWAHGPRRQNVHDTLVSMLCNQFLEIQVQILYQVLQVNIFIFLMLISSAWISSSCGGTVFEAGLQCLEWGYSVWSGGTVFGVGGTVFGVGVQCLEWGYSVWSGATVFGVGVQCLEWGYSVWSGGTVLEWGYSVWSGGTVFAVGVKCLKWG